jgi:hypothetical protein
LGPLAGPYVADYFLVLLEIFVLFIAIITDFTSVVERVQPVADLLLRIAICSGCTLEIKIIS